MIRPNKVQVAISGIIKNALRHQQIIKLWNAQWFIKLLIFLKRLYLLNNLRPHD